MGRSRSTATSSISTTNTSTVEDNRAAVESGGIAATGGGSVVSVERVPDAVFEILGEAFAGAGEIARASVASSEEAVEALQAQRARETPNTLQDLAPIILIGGLVLVVARMGD